MKNGSKFGRNIRVIREAMDISQDMVAADLKISREALSSYENRGVNPPMRKMLRIAEYFDFDVNTLLTKKLTEQKVQEYKSNKFLNEIPVRTVNNENEENIHLVEQKAHAGYIAGIEDKDPDSLRELPIFQIPILPKDGSYRIFEITGNSMLPIPDKSLIVGKSIRSANELQDGICYVVVTNDGIVFKKVFNQNKANKTLRLQSLNPKNDDYEVPSEDIRQLWKFVGFYSKEIPEVEPLIQELVLAVQEVKERLSQRN